MVAEEDEVEEEEEEEEPVEKDDDGLAGVIFRPPLEAGCWMLTWPAPFLPFRRDLTYGRGGGGGGVGDEEPT